MLKIPCQVLSCLRDQQAVKILTPTNSTKFILVFLSAIILSETKPRKNIKLIILFSQGIAKHIKLRITHRHEVCDAGDELAAKTFVSTRDQSS